MQCSTKMRSRTLSLALAASAAFVLPGTGLLAPRSAAQVQAPAAAGGRLAGTVTTVTGNVLTVKDDKGVESKLTVPDSSRILQLPAGSKSLASATPIKVADVAVGDRILAKTSQDGATLTASTLIAMKQADIAQKQQHDREDWQTRGISGVVKSVDPAAQTVTVSTGSGAAAKTVLVQTSKTTTIRRYAPDSTKFDDAKSATLEQILPGDQLRAKGDKGPDGGQLTAEDLVAGTFRNIAGTVVSVDAGANTVTVNDLATKKPFTVNINADSQLHKLPPMMAQGIARRLEGGAGATGPMQGGAQGAPSGPNSRPIEEGPSTGAATRGPGAGGPPGARPSGSQPGADPVASGAVSGSGQRGGDIQQVLNRAPILQLSDLKKGDAVMVLTTEGQTPGAATAITLLAGVEPLLQASPSASQGLLSASWNVGGSGAGQDAQ